MYAVRFLICKATLPPLVDSTTGLFPLLMCKSLRFIENRLLDVIVDLQTEPL
ncbi:hypothetical protein Tola_0709 [Tolumonas auensis DSM 9187]|uniref:Uncharacterized protein n=1 Tax=Tolumonas auensis (strain DSM 9187 / NBRC 110442 / TA 4) TaxID=595494 RepID=C4LBA2_TOLAT|nr:hypothetical protein Tola_0709 [Tolumonas auensis DSM 9187]